MSVILDILNERAILAFRNATPSARRHLALIGASGSGKSAIWGRLRSDKLAERHAEFPRRYVSRVRRADDDSRENVSIEKNEFVRMFQAGQIAFYWEKAVPSGPPQWYGFPFCAEHTIVYGCNNAFVLNQESLVSHIDPRDVWLKVYISCSEDEILRRLNLRVGSSAHSVKLPPHHSSDVSRAAKMCDIILSNEQSGLRAATRAIRDIIVS